MMELTSCKAVRMQFYAVEIARYVLVSDITSDCSDHDDTEIAQV